MKRRNLKHRINIAWLLSTAIMVFLTSCATADMEMKSETGIKKGEVAKKSSPLPKEISEEMTCPVCNMFPGRFPRLQAQIIFKDNSFVAFDGPKDMFKFLLGPERYDSKHKGKDIAVAYVRDYKTGRWIDAKDAYFIVGSNVFGPMGRELIPFSDHMSAVNFKDEHGGSPIDYTDITMDLLMSLDRGKVKAPMQMHKMDGKHEMDMKKEHNMKMEEE